MTSWTSGFEDNAFQALPGSGECIGMAGHAQAQGRSAMEMEELLINRRSGLVSAALQHLSRSMEVELMYRCMAMEHLCRRMAALRISNSLPLTHISRMGALGLGSVSLVHPMPGLVSSPPVPLSYSQAPYRGLGSGVLVGIDALGHAHTNALLDPMHPFYQSTPSHTSSFCGSAAGAVPRAAGGATSAIMVAPSAAPSTYNMVTSVPEPPMRKRKNAENAPGPSNVGGDSKRQAKSSTSLKEMLRFAKANGRPGRNLGNFGSLMKEAAQVVEIYSGQMLDLDLVPNDILTVVPTQAIEDCGCGHVYQFAALAE